MKFDHVVKHDGIVYPVGAEVPTGVAKIEQVAEVAEYSAETPSKQWTKTEINRMVVDELRKLAAENGIENSEETSGADLKKALIDKFGL